MQRITLDDIARRHPCTINEEGREPWFADRKSIYGEKPMDVLVYIDKSLKSGKIPPENILWVVLQPNYIDEVILHQFAYDVIDHVKKKYKGKDGAVTEALSAKKQWMSNECSSRDLKEKRNVELKESGLGKILYGEGYRAADAATNWARSLFKGKAMETELLWQVDRLVELLGAV